VRSGNRIVLVPKPTTPDEALALIRNNLGRNTVRVGITQYPAGLGIIEAGVKLFPVSLSYAVDRKVADDPAVKKQWEEVSTRFRYVFADPETAFRAMNFDAVLADKQVALQTLDKLAVVPAAVGPLKGKIGILASKSDREERRVAEVNVPALKRDIETYLRIRETTMQRIEGEEKSQRQRVSIDIPALSPAAQSVLERVRDAIDRNDLPAAMAYALSNPPWG
jgi:hypothetical protein